MSEWKKFFNESDEKKFDYRLAEKKVAEGFLTQEEIENFKKAVQEETEFDFTSHDGLHEDSEEATAE